MHRRGTVLVVGATGAQGGGVARHLLARGDYTVRALTRHDGSDKARQLAAGGAELVVGDLADKEALRAAVEGCTAVFGVTNYWEHFEEERDQGRNLVDAVADAGVPHFVLSTLPSAKRLSDGEIEVPHFDVKAEVEVYARERVPNATFVHVAFYFENFTTIFPFEPLHDGSFGFGFPQGDTPLAAVSVEDVGGVVAAVLDRPDDFRRVVLGVVGDDRPPAEYAAVMSEVTGERVVYQHVERETYASLGFPGADDLAAMFDLNRRYILQRQDDLERSRALYPPIHDFRTWAEANAGALKARLVR